MNEKEMVARNVLNDLNRAVADAHPKFAAKFEAKAAAVGVQSAAVAPAEGFCAICAKVRPFLNMAIKGFSLFNPSIAAMAKTFMTALYGTLIPLVCGQQ